MDGNKVAEETTYNHTVTKSADIKALIEAKRFTVTFDVDKSGGDPNGKLTATEAPKELTSPAIVEGGHYVTFKAIPDDGYEVDKWTWTGADEKDIANAKISDEEYVLYINNNIDVKVKFKHK